MKHIDIKALIDKRQKNGMLAPIFKPSFTCYQHRMCAYCLYSNGHHAKYCKRPLR